MAYYALDLQTGQFIHLPFEGGLLRQPKWMLDCIYYAWRTWLVLQKRRGDMTASDGEWMENVIKPPKPGQETREWLISD